MIAHRKPFAAALMLHVALLAFPPDGGAQEPPPVPLRFGSHATFQRMVLDWPQTVPYFVEQSDRRTILSFDAPATFRAVQIANGLAQLATKVTAASDGRTSRISFEMADGISLRHFRADTKIVVDLMHGGRVPKVPDGGAAASSADASAAPGATGGRPWENRPPTRAAAAQQPSWIDAPKALAPPPMSTLASRHAASGAVLAPAAASPAGRAPTASASQQAGTAPVRLASAETAAPKPPAPELPRAAALPVPAPPWRQAVRKAACRGDLEGATAILAERMAASRLDPIDWYNLTWLLRTLAGATMEPPQPAGSAVYDAPLVGLCSGKPVAGTVATWQRLAHAGQFTEFLIDVAPASDPGRR